MKRCLIPWCGFLLLRFGNRQGEVKGGPHVILTLDPDFAAVTFYRNLAKSKPDAQAPGFMSTAQAGKFIEDPFTV
jgi:hypothetical protein